jgi:hypothetical protein
MRRLEFHLCLLLRQHLLRTVDDLRDANHELDIDAEAEFRTSGRAAFRESHPELSQAAVEALMWCTRSG